MKSMTYLVAVLGAVPVVTAYSCSHAPPVCSGGSCASWPLMPSAATTGSNIATFAIDTVWTGDTARGSNRTSTTAWKGFGFNLDGKTSDIHSIDVCARASGSPSSVQADAIRTCTSTTTNCTVDGADNSFGANVLPIFQSAGNTPSPSAFVTGLVRRGVYTLQLRVFGLDGNPRQTSRGLSLQTFEAAPFDSDAMPRFAPTEDWPVLLDNLANPNDLDAGSKYRFDDAYIVDGTVASGFGALLIGFPLATVTLRVPLKHAIITMDLTDDGLGVTNGTIAGVLPVDDFIAAWQRVAGLTSKSLCGSAFDGIAQQIRQTADIRSDGSNIPGLPCDAISFAIGFEGKRIADPKRAGATPPAWDPCVISKDASAEND